VSPSGSGGVEGKKKIPVYLFMREGKRKGKNTKLQCPRIDGSERRIGKKKKKPRITLPTTAIGGRRGLLALSSPLSEEQKPEGKRRNDDRKSGKRGEPVNFWPTSPHWGGKKASLAPRSALGVLGGGKKGRSQADRLASSPAVEGGKRLGKEISLPSGRLIPGSAKKGKKKRKGASGRVLLGKRRSDRL